MIIREFTHRDTSTIEKLMSEFEDYLVAIDDVRFIRPFTDNGREYTALRLEKIEKENGVILLAEDNAVVVGMVVGVMDEQDRVSVLEEGERKYARVIDLYVQEQYRNKGVGKQLIQAVENYFKEKGVAVLTIGVLAPNTHAYEFYKRSGYRDRAIDLIKVL